MIVTVVYELDGQTYTDVQNTTYRTPDALAAALLAEWGGVISNVQVWEGTDTTSEPDATVTR